MSWCHGAGWVAVADRLGTRRSTPKIVGSSAKSPMSRRVLASPPRRAGGAVLSHRPQPVAPGSGGGVVAWLQPPGAPRRDRFNEFRRAHAGSGTTSATEFLVGSAARPSSADAGPKWADVCRSPPDIGRNQANRCCRVACVGAAAPRTPPERVAFLTTAVTAFHALGRTSGSSRYHVKLWYAWVERRHH